MKFHFRAVDDGNFIISATERKFLDRIHAAAGSFHGLSAMKMPFVGSSRFRSWASVRVENISTPG